jgi:pyochelin biosynthetic protein PchC
VSVGFQVLPAGAAAIWLRRLAPVTAPWARLVCFPHAGGMAAFFRPWRDYLLPGVELYAVQYPGRMDRITDPCVDNMDLMANSVTAAIQSLLDCPVALFGHSLGAVVAYEVARRMPPPARLFVSGRTAPDRPRPVKQLGSDDMLWDDIERLGGTRQEVLANPELRQVFLPALRSDYRLSDAYRPRPGPRLECPITALLGEQDSEVDMAEAASWAGVTRAEFSIRAFPGEHFYLTSQVPEVVGEIMHRLVGSAPARYAGWAGP